MARSPQQDLLIVVLLMAALGVAWYYTGGTSTDLAKAGPFFQSPKIGDTLPVFRVPGVELPNVPPSSNEPPRAETISSYLGSITEEKSPYAAYVSLEQGNASSGLESEYVTIRVNYNASNKIVLSGWRLESTATGLSTTLPLASELPAQGSVNTTSPVGLSPGQTAYVVTGRSPIGSSFRTNLCTGYFEQFQNFTPGLKIECPNPQEEAQAVIPTGSYSDECYDIVRSIPRCTLVIQSIPGSAGAACESFISSTLSYTGCMNKHKNDPKFYKDDWYLYINRDQELWRSRSERIRLLDENGKVVGVVSY